MSVTKAFLLAGGLGTRLRPLTDHTPKCLVPIRGKPLLDIWLDFCQQAGIQDVLINTHHLAGQVRDWAGSRRSCVRIHLFHEESLLGSAGTVAANREFVGRDRNFFVFYADNLVNVDLASLVALHERHSGAMTLGLFHTPRPWDCGIVTLDDSGRITSFEEKPPHPRGDLASAGIYVARSTIFNVLPRNQFADFGRDIMPALAGELWGELLEGFMLDIGTPENYQRAQIEWPSFAGEGVSA